MSEGVPFQAMFRRVIDRANATDAEAAELIDKRGLDGALIDLTDLAVLGAGGEEHFGSRVVADVAHSVQADSELVSAIYRDALVAYWSENDAAPRSTQIQILLLLQLNAYLRTVRDDRAAGR